MHHGFRHNEVFLLMGIARAFSKNVLVQHITKVILKGLSEIFRALSPSKTLQVSELAEIGHVNGTSRKEVE